MGLAPERSYDADIGPVPGAGMSEFEEPLFDNSTKDRTDLLRPGARVDDRVVPLGAQVHALCGQDGYEAAEGVHAVVEDGVFKLFGDDTAGCAGQRPARCDELPAPDH